MLNIIIHLGNANQNYIEILLPHTHQNSYNQKDKQQQSFDKDVENLEASYIAGGNVELCSHIVKQVGSSLLYDLGILLLGIYRRETKIPHKNLYTNVHHVYNKKIIPS